MESIQLSESRQLTYRDNAILNIGGPHGMPCKLLDGLGTGFPLHCVRKHVEQQLQVQVP
jgi:hypothetical protein